MANFKMKSLGLLCLCLAGANAHIPGLKVHVPRQNANASMEIFEGGTGTLEVPLPTETVVMNNQSRHHRRPPPAVLLPIKVDSGVTIVANTTFSTSLVSSLSARSIDRGPTVAATTRSTFLVIARDSVSAYSAQSGLNDYGIPFETLLVPANGTELPVLNSSATVGNYGGIVVLSEVSYPNAQGLYASGLTNDQWNAMFNYQANFGVRMVRLDVVPSASTGTVSIGDCCDTGQEQILSINDTSSFPTAGLVQGAKLSSVGLYHYPGKITNSTLATAFATFLPNDDFANNSVAAVINNFGTRQQMVFFLAFATDWSETSNILQHAWIGWATRGLYAGYRRAMLNTQVDDMFLTSPMYYPPGGTFRVSPADIQQHISWMKSINSRLPAGSNYTIEVGFNGNGNIGVISCGSSCDAGTSTSVISTSTSSVTSRITTTSIPSIITVTVTATGPSSTTSESRHTRTKTTGHTTIYTTITVNGPQAAATIALDAAADAPDAADIYAKTTAARECGSGPITYPAQPADFNLEYVKPTGGGVNLWPSTASAYPYGIACLQLDPLEIWWANPSNLAQFFLVSHTFTHEDEDNATYYDVTREITWNQAWLKQVGIANVTGFSAQGLIPPAITGLHNGDALRAWWDGGIRNVVGDNTRPVLLNTENEHWPLMTTTNEDNFPGIQITPRWATNIYYNCDTTDCDVEEWKDIAAGTGDISDLLALEKNTNARHVLALHHDAFMFHQANMRYVGVSTTTVNGVNQQLSLLQMWVETVLAEYSRLVTWPIISLKHDDLAKAFADRMTRDQCKYALTYTLDTTAKTITAVTVSAGTTNSCAAEVPVTLPGKVTDTKGYRTEQLGSDPLTIWVSLVGQSVTFTLAKAVPW